MTVVDMAEAWSTIFRNVPINVHYKEGHQPEGQVICKEES